MKSSYSLLQKPKFLLSLGEVGEKVDNKIEFYFEASGDRRLKKKSINVFFQNARFSDQSHSCFVRVARMFVD